MVTDDFLVLFALLLAGLPKAPNPPLTGEPRRRRHLTAIKSDPTRFQNLDNTGGLFRVQSE